MINKTLNNIFKGDKVIWMVFFFLCIISIIEVYSASSQLTYKDGSYLAPVLKHIGILLMGIFCMVVTLNIKCKYFKIVTPFLLILSVLMLIWVLFAGQTTNGAARWVGILGMKFQPRRLRKARWCWLLLRFSALCRQKRVPTIRSYMRTSTRWAFPFATSIP